MKKYILIFLFILSCQKDDNSDIIDLLESRIEFLSSKSNNLEDNLASLTSSLSSFVSLSESLNQQQTNDINSFASIVNQLVSEISELNSIISDLVSDNDALSQSNSSLASIISSLETQITSLQTQITSLETQINDINTELDNQSQQSQTNTGSQSSDVIYLDSNGVTIKAYDSANIGDTGVINGVEYTVVSNTSLRDWVLDQRDLSKAVTTKVTSFGYLFRDLEEVGINKESLNPDVSSWDTSNVVSMGSLFQHMTSFNRDLSNWDVSNVTDMQSFFQILHSMGIFLLGMYQM